MSVYRKYPLPKIGQKINSWTVRVLKTNPRGKVITFICECSCGSYKSCNYNDVRNGQSSSCRNCVGNGYRDAEPEYELKIRLLYKVYGAFRRCNNKDDKNYENYGGRGIKVMFPDTESFLKYIVTLEGYDDPSLTLDRKDNNGHYEPGNLRFATRREQNLNRRMPIKNKIF